MAGPVLAITKWERVMIETVDSQTNGALVRHIEGERAGTRASCSLSSLDILEKEIPSRNH